MADAKILEVKPGSLIVLRGVHLGALDADLLIHHLEEACGHKQFVLLHTSNDDDAVSMGPDEAADLIRDAIRVEVERVTRVPRAGQGGWGTPK